jgi:hypothetical protein
VHLELDGDAATPAGRGERPGHFGLHDLLQFVAV